MAESERATQSSLEKALDLCEVLSGSQRGYTIRELSRTLHQPPSTIHRLLAALKRRGYVRQDEDTTRYSLTLKMLDLSFKLLGRSELRLHAYPVVREYVLRTGLRAFIAVPATGDVTYIWSAGADAVGMHTVYGRQMPGHCSIYVDPQATRRLSCFRLEQSTDARAPDRLALRFGPPAADLPLQRLLCACAPVRDYTGREVARVGVFAHASQEQPFATDQTSASVELARLLSLRLGHLPGMVEDRPAGRVGARPAS